MDHDTYFTIADGRLVGLQATTSLPPNFPALLPDQIELFLEQRVVTIGAWVDAPGRPHVLALDAGGSLISVLAVNHVSLETLPHLLLDIERWLDPLQLRDLSDLAGDPIAFYEGLWDLSPNATMTLHPKRRIVLITALESVDLSEWPEALDPSSVEIHYLDVLSSPSGGAPILTRRMATADDVARAESAEPLADVIDIATSDHTTGAPEPLPPPPDAVSGDETRMSLESALLPLPEPPTVDLRTAPPPPPESSTIDLRTAPPAVSPIGGSVLRPAPRIRSGATFPVARLPLLFDPLGANLLSISDELFAVDDHLVLVEKLPERRRATPFEDRNRFRWESSSERIELLETHLNAPDGSRRTLHLFVETERQSEHCVYIGELTRTESKKGASDRTAWFSISPLLDNDLYRLLRKGRLPEHVEAPTVDFGTLDA